jgi:signal transduction histidine kinase
MRTKLFLAFLFVILLAFISNIVFERLIIGDFDDYLAGTEEDSIYWVLAAVEGSYMGDTWNTLKLNEALHWGLMLGLESYVVDHEENQIMSSADVLFSMDSGMRNRMNAFLKLPTGTGEYTWYPLYMAGNEIGKIYFRPLERIGLTPVKEVIFRKRGKEFLTISFLIAGGGALVLYVLFTVFLSNPIRRLTASAEKIAQGDFTVHEPLPHKKFKDEIDRLTETFNYMAEALRREDALRKHLTSNIAHELRTPLTIIKGNLEAIEDGVLSDPGAVIENIRTEIDRLVSLVEGIEDITRAEASFFKKGLPEEVDLREFVESVAEGMKKLIHEKGLFLKTEGPRMKVGTDPEKLHIALKNLLSNAYKYTETGGITIRWGNGRTLDSRGFYLSVEDTGEGIASDRKMLVFDRFHKGENSAGKGLGLAIVKELVGVMGGDVKIESEERKGSRFTMIFPKNDA